MYNYSPKGTLIENIDGQIYDIVDLYSGEITPISLTDLAAYSFSPSSCLIKDLDGKLYSIVDLYNGTKKEIKPKDLKEYKYSPVSCLIMNVDGTTTNIIDTILMYREQGGTSAIPKTYKEVVEARVGIDNKKYDTLDKRIDSEIGILNNKGHIAIKMLKEEKAKSDTLKEENITLKERASAIEESNNNLQKINDIQDGLIDTTMMATDELYVMVEPLLQDSAQSINNKGGQSKMVDLYAAMVMRGLKTIEQVPARYREEVRAIISELEK